MQLRKEEDNLPRLLHPRQPMRTDVREIERKSQDERTFGSAPLTWFPLTSFFINLSANIVSTSLFFPLISSSANTRLLLTTFCQLVCFFAGTFAALSFASVFVT